MNTVRSVTATYAARRIGRPRTGAHLDHGPELPVPRGPRVAFWLRHTLWRNVFHLIGGYRVRGEVPVEPVIVVANHSSHADAPAIIAALDSRHRPVAAAAYDYWFASPARRSLLAAVGPAFPVRRDGSSYREVSRHVGTALARGESVLLFPEGTRSLDGALGPFRSGPAHLAQEHGVSLVPVAIVGTWRLLPKGGRPQPGPVEVRVGKPIRPQDWDGAGIEQAREAIATMLADGPPSPSLSRTWRAFGRFMDSRAGMVGAAAWGAAEALAWPVTAEMYLTVFGVARPKRLPHAAAALTAGTVLGVVGHAALARAGLRLPAPLTTDPMAQRAEAHLAAGAKGIWRQALNGVPIKLYAAAAGRSRIALPGLAAHTAAARGVRNGAVAAVLFAVSWPGRHLFARFFGPYQAALALAYPIALGAVIRAWRPAGRIDKSQRR